MVFWTSGSLHGRPIELSALDIRTGADRSLCGGPTGFSRGVNGGSASGRIRPAAHVHPLLRATRAGDRAVSGRELAPRWRRSPLRSTNAVLGRGIRDADRHLLFSGRARRWSEHGADAAGPRPPD